MLFRRPFSEVRTINKVILIGRLVADPELRYTQSNKAVASYRIAVDRIKKADGQQEADFINIVAWGSSGEFASKYFSKGMKVAIEGRIQTGSYEKDGVKHYTTDVVVERQEFCESKSSSNYESSYVENVGNAGFQEITDEDDGELPF